MNKRTKIFSAWEQVPLVLTVPEAALLLNMHPNYITKLCRANVLTGFKCGKEWRINKGSVMKYLGLGTAADRYNAITAPDAPAAPTPPSAPVVGIR